VVTSWRRQRRRREFIAFVSGATLWLVVVHAQQRFKIGMFDTGIGAFFTVPFMSKLEELGFVEGKNLVVERRSAEGDNERLKEFAADLVRQRVDVIVTAGTPAGFAAERATSTIPTDLAGCAG
jgi:putative tryptophan/tyrosine transport system substrate-binding protein